MSARSAVSIAVSVPAAPMAMRTMMIGELAKAAGTQVEPIRFCEREGLLPAPERSGGNYRVYGDAQVERLSFIRHCRNLDIALDEIHVLLRFKGAPAESCRAVNEVLDEHIAHAAELSGRRVTSARGV
jgi:DNA-binding transcriptional MerR regulator